MTTKERGFLIGIGLYSTHFPIDILLPLNFLSISGWTLINAIQLSSLLAK